MYQRTRIICLRETDATGVIYFSELFKLALEVFEAYLYEKQFTLQHMIEQKAFLMPIVHAEADYTSPLRVGDRVSIELTTERIGTSSFTLKTLFSCRDNPIGIVKIVHATVSPQSGRSIPIPRILLDALQGM